MNQKTHTATWSLAGLALGIAIVVGCEVKSKSDVSGGLVITPGIVEITLAQAIEFIATGGFTYEWSLEDEALGSLSTRTGDRTVYTSTINPGSNRTSQVLTVLSFIDSQSGTNAVDFSATAEAFITHVGDVPLTARVTITPSSITISEGDTIKFSAIGGSSHTWSLSDETIGLLSSRNAPETRYTSIKDPGEGATQRQQLTVTAPEGSFTATITHVGDVTPDVTVTPTEATLFLAGSVGLTAAGGDGSFAWSLSDETIGTLSTRSGPATTYTSLVAPTGTTVIVQTVTVNSGGKSAQALMKHQ